MIARIAVSITHFAYIYIIDHTNSKIQIKEGHIYIK